MIALVLADGCSLLLGLIFFNAMFVDHYLKLREQERAFGTLDRVMDKVPVPYVRLDGTGRFLT